MTRVTAVLSATSGQPALLPPHLRFKFLSYRGLHAILFHTLRGTSRPPAGLVAFGLRGRKLHHATASQPGPGNGDSLGFWNGCRDQRSGRHRLRHHLRSHLPCRDTSDVDRNSSCWFLFWRMEWRVHRHGRMHSPDVRRPVCKCQFQRPASGPSSGDGDYVGFRDCD